MTSVELLKTLEKCCDREGSDTINCSNGDECAKFFTILSQTHLGFNTCFSRNKLVGLCVLLHVTSLEHSQSIDQFCCNKLELCFKLVRFTQPAVF